MERALEEALSRGREDILVIPMFVSPSQHSSVEIHEKLGLPEGERGRDKIVGDRAVRIRYANEVGLEPGLADIPISMVEE